jgi:K+-transporting ATPase KdpF subunit
MFHAAEIRPAVNVTERDVCPHLHRADAGDIRPARLDTEVGRGAVSQDLVGLALAILLALFLFAALLFPERF